jgi:DNA-binding XRE family transcriptional regulator
MADSQLQESIELIGKALGLVRQTLNHEPPVPYGAWPHQMRYECESVAAGALARLDKDQRKQAKLRAREQVAQQLYGKDFSILSTFTQNEIAQVVNVATSTYDLALEGHIEPLPKGNPRRAELEPEAVRLDGRVSS